MKIKIFIFFIIISFSTCKEKKNTVTNFVQNDFYPYSQHFDGHLSFYDNINMLLEKKNYREGSVIHFVDFKEDSIIFNKKILKVPVFVQDFFIKEKDMKVKNKIMIFLFFLLKCVILILR